MRIKFILTIITGMGLLLSCNNQKNTNSTDGENEAKHSTESNKSDLVGSWEDQSASALHFSLYSDGTAQSDNMATLLYQQWYVEGDELFLVAKSIGNSQTFIDTTAYTI